MNPLHLIIVFSTLLKMSDQPGKDTTQLRSAIAAVFATHPEGKFGVAFKNLDNNETFFWNEHDNFHAASTMKTPVLIETYKQSTEGRFSIGDSIIVKNSFASIVDGSLYSQDSVNDSEHDLYLHIGEKLPLYDLLFRMITESSNLATNNIIDLVGAKNVTATMRSIGAKDMTILRGVEDNKAFQLGLNNTTTAYDLMLVMEGIAKATVIDKKSAEAIINILMQQHFKQVIPGKLPPEVKVANKTGSFTGVRHDSGIVFLPDGRRYVIVLLSRGIENDDTASNALATVSRILYDYVAGSK